MRKVKLIKDTSGKTYAFCPYCNEFAYEKDHCVFCGKKYKLTDGEREEKQGFGVLRKMIEEATKNLVDDCGDCDHCHKQIEGEWRYHECVSSYDGTKSGYSCSCCHAFVDEEVFDTDEFHKKFCGNCGARMKGGE